MQRILVTGANKGIGRAIVAAVLEQVPDSMVFLGSRDPGRGDAARAALIADHPDWTERIEVLEIDVSSEASVTAAAARVKGATGSEGLYGLVNNAGIGFSDAGMAQVLEVNTRGVRRVCDAFLPLLSDGGRIVNVTSASGPNFVARCSAARQAGFVDPSVTWDQIEATMAACLALESSGGGFEAEGWGNGEAYGLSKACTNNYTLLLAREQPRLKVNACTPGFIETDMTRGFATSSGRTPAEMGMKSPAEGTRSTVHLLFGEVQSGHYYGSDGVRSPFDRYRAPGDPPHTGTP